MTRNSASQPRRRSTGEGTDLRRLLAPPAIWASHFLLSYVAVAVYCERAGRAAAIEPMRVLVLAATAIALGLLAWVAWGLWQVRARSVTDDDFTFEHNSPEERHRFLSHMGLMLCTLSAVAVLFVAMPVLVLGTCR